MFSKLVLRNVPSVKDVLAFPPSGACPAIPAARGWGRTIKRKSIDWAVFGLVFLIAASGLQSTVLAAPPSGLTLPAFEMSDFRGRKWTQQDFADRPLLVVAFLGTECPLAKLYAVRLAQLQRDLGPQIALLAVMSNKQDSLQDIESFANRHELEYPVVKDLANRFADQLGAERTPEVLLFDGERTLRYWGRIDDQYGIGYARDEPQQEDLKQAILAIQAGRSVMPQSTRSVGCIIGRTKLVDQSAKITFNSHVAAILQRHCVECHRDGEIAPFALTDYADASGWADMIVETVQEGRMPPWHADPAHGSFTNARQLSDEERWMLQQWADAGAPAGKGQFEMTLPDRVEGWQLPREPDLVIPVSPQPFTVPATGTVRYQYFRVDPQLDRDVWLEAAELRPGNRAVVHHILCFAEKEGSGERLDAARGFLVGYVPGARVELGPAGMAKKIEAGSQLIFQVHYTPIGTEQEDQSQLGLVFADSETITHEVRTYSAVQPRLSIPPGDPSHRVTASTPLTEGLLLGLSPHMHLRGKAFRYELVRDGEKQILLDIPNYDFNWQTTYMLSEPMEIKMGDRMDCTAWYDNSERNPHNPDPTATVRWGDQTYDEMMIGYFHYAVPFDPNANKQAAKPAAGGVAEQVQRAASLRIFNALDKDGTGRIRRDQTPQRYWEAFDRLDKNRDGVLTREEVESAFSR